MKKVYIQGGLTLAFLFLLGGANWYHNTHTPFIEAGTIGANVSSFKELTDRFTSLAKTKGAVYAFDVLKIAPLPPNTDLHLLGHTIGDILYTQQGVEGIKYCTQDFRNACSHTIAIGALNEYGADGALPLIHDACKKAPGGPGAYTMCYHGLGHGVFAYFGYDLTKTIALCKKTGTTAYHNQEYVECVGGSIMELMGGGGHDHTQWLVARQKYLTKDPLSPCMDAVVPDEDKSICLIYLTPELFTRAGADLANPSPTTFPLAFSYCNAIPKTNQPLRDACYGGFGKEFIVLAGSRDIRNVGNFTDDQYQKTLGWCAMAGSPDGVDACTGDALSSVFWGGENNPNAAFRFCSLALGSVQTACYGHLSGEVSRYIEGDKKAALCAKLPNEFQKNCALPSSLPI